MKRSSLLILALGAAGAAPAFAQNNVTIYGRINTTVESQKDVSTEGRLSKMENNASRWGIKGSEDLGGGLKANFLLESGFASDTGENPPDGGIFRRESWVGLSGNFGAVKLGNFTGATALYYATSDYIGMHNHETGNSADIFYVGAGSTLNSVSYSTPSFNGLVGEVQYGFKETNASGAKNTLALVATYDAGPLHLGGGYSSGPTGLGGTPTQDGKEWGIRGLYELGSFVVGATYIANEAQDAVDKRKRQAFRVAGMYTMGSSEFHVNVGFATKLKLNGTTLDNTDAVQYTLGYNYNLSKRTKLYGYYTGVNNKSDVDYGTFDLGQDPSIIAVGVRHAF